MTNKGSAAAETMMTMTASFARAIKIDGYETKKQEHNSLRSCLKSYQ